MLELLSARGEVAIAGRIGRQRLWDLPERVYPGIRPLPADEAKRLREKRRLRSLGVARAKTVVVPGEPFSVADAGVPVAVEGLEGSGGQTQTRSTSLSPAVRRCCRRSTAWSTTGNAL